MSEVDKLRQDLDESKVLLTIEEDDWAGVCHPDIESPELVSGKHGAPFNWRTSGDPPSPDEVGERFGQIFDSKVDEVWEKINETDDPLDVIMDLEPDQMIVEPTEEE